MTQGQLIQNKVMSILPALSSLSYMGSPWDSMVRSLKESVSSSFYFLDWPVWMPAQVAVLNPPSHCRI